MRIKVLEALAGPICYDKGGIYDVSLDLAKSLLNAGYAEVVPDEDQVAVVKPKEIAKTKKGK